MMPRLNTRVARPSRRSGRIAREVNAESLPTFSVITPGACSAGHPCPCNASVADQLGVGVEHLHGRSGPGLEGPATDVSKVNMGLCAVGHDVEPASGFIDVAAGRATGDVLTVMRCEEQLLPDALRRVGEYFAAHPQVDVLFTGALSVDAAGRRVPERFAVLPYRSPEWVHRLSRIPCGAFARRSAFAGVSPLFGLLLRRVGEIAWVFDALARTKVIGLLPQYTSTFVASEPGPAIGPMSRVDRATSRAEADVLLSRQAEWAGSMKTFIRVHRRLQRLIKEQYGRRQIEYAIFTQETPMRRATFKVPSAYLTP